MALAAIGGMFIFFGLLGRLNTATMHGEPGDNGAVAETWFWVFGKWWKWYLGVGCALVLAGLVVAFV